MRRAWADSEYSKWSTMIREDASSYPEYQDHLHEIADAVANRNPLATR